MDEYGWGLTSAGFRRPTYNELLDALEHKARELFGATANLTVRSPLGLFLRIFAWNRDYRGIFPCHIITTEPSSV